MLHSKAVGIGLLLLAPAALVGCHSSSATGDAGTPQQDGGTPQGDAGIPQDAGCASPVQASTLADAGPVPGALIGVTMQSQVGVLLDEIPDTIRERVATAILAESTDFWTARATDQIKLTTYRLVFRRQFDVLADGGTADSLPIPTPATIPDAWQITLMGTPTRMMVDGHDLVVVDYNLATTILTDPVSPGVSQPGLGTVGGTWQEPFTFPIDPELLLQRTGYACLDEAEFPPNSVDSQEIDSFYDYTCQVEPVLSRNGCHQTVLPDLACTDALASYVGHIDTTLNFQRLAWDQTLADSVRRGPVTSTSGADMQVVDSEFKTNRIIYRYIPPDSCTLVEKCVGAPGWRRLLQFSTADMNTGSANLNIGRVDYFNADGGVGDQLIQNGVFEYSACHEHYHFMHYGSFSYGADEATTTKRGFCLQSTLRASNNEIGPLLNPYYDCGYQGVEIGWADEYKAGLECQWLDITDIDTSNAPVTNEMTFTSNPDGFLCEGAPTMDGGSLVFEPTPFTTLAGAPVNRPACDYTSSWFANNVDSYGVTIPSPGDTYVTLPCDRGEFGALRNCAMQSETNVLSCTPGATVTLNCGIPAGSAPQVIRACEASTALDTGIACLFDHALVNAEVDADAGTQGLDGGSVTFVCPPARDTTEPGGTYSLYGGALFPADTQATITCH